MKNNIITTTKKIKLYDDTGRNDGYIVKDILFENDNIIVGNITFRKTTHEVLIYKKNNIVVCSVLDFYYGKNLNSKVKLNVLNTTPVLPTNKDVSDFLKSEYMGFDEHSRYLEQGFEHGVEWVRDFIKNNHK